MLKQLKGIECNFCSRPATKDVLGEIEIFANRLVKMHLCDACYKSYLTGNKFGQLQVHQNVISLISSCDNESPVLDLKMKLAEIAPLSKKFLFTSDIKKFKYVNPKDLYENLNKKVVGQDIAKKRISLAVFEHMRNIHNSVSNDKQNILFLGPSGSGKTLIVNTISKYLDVPFVSGDATSFSPTGFQGSDADSVITDLLLKANGEPGLAEKGVVFIDENYNRWKLRTAIFNHARELWGNTNNRMFRYMELRKDSNLLHEYLGNKRVYQAYLIGGLFGGVIYILAYNIFPAFSAVKPFAFALGASAGVLFNSCTYTGTNSPSICCCSRSISIRCTSVSSPVAGSDTAPVRRSLDARTRPSSDTSPDGAGGNSLARGMKPRLTRTTMPSSRSIGVTALYPATPF
jgi:hypothetical protein